MKRYLMLFILAALPALPALAAKFEHKAHLEYVDEGDCMTCHLAGAKAIVPERAVCLECHDDDFMNEVEMPALKTHGPVWALNHRPYAKADDRSCSVCHQQSECLDCHKAGRADEQGALGNNMINVHRSDFQVTHPIAARTDQQLCKSCHENRFCVDCHREFQAGRASGPSHRRTFDLGASSTFSQVTDIHRNLPAGFACENCHTAGAVVTDIHEWSAGHKRDARKNLATCQACHPGGDVCITCHSDRGGVLGANPHGSGSGDRLKRIDRATNGKTCRKCHDTW